MKGRVSAAKHGGMLSFAHDFAGSLKKKKGPEKDPSFLFSLSDLADYLRKSYAKHNKASTQKTLINQ